MKTRIRNNKMKRSVVEEIIKTEMSYQRGIDWMRKWKNKLVEKEITDQQEAYGLFWNIEDICNISNTFLDLWKQKFENWTPKCWIGNSMMV